MCDKSVAKRARLAPGSLASQAEMDAYPARGEKVPLAVEGAFVYYGNGNFDDARGFYEEIDLPLGDHAVLESGYAQSKRNVMRGMHCSPYAKIVVCLAGEMWDAIVDFRPESPTFGRWDAVRLSQERRTRIFVPPGVAHGYMAMKDGTVSLYLKLGRYVKDKEYEFNCLDPAIQIPWPRPLDGSADYTISAKDRALPSAAEVMKGRQERSRL